MFLRRILLYLKALALRVLLLTVTPFRLRGIVQSKSAVVSGTIYRWFEPSDRAELRQLLVQLNNGVGFSGRELLYRFFGSRLILLATIREGLAEKIIGVNLYYFNLRDIKEHTVHEGFIGVHPNHRGRGIAPLMRALAREHFRRGSVLRGISTRISVNNKASMKAADDPGAEIVERYWDPVMNEDRIYLIKWFDPARNTATQPN